MATVSVVISAFNEEKTIQRVLKSISWADEIIVVDNESLDETAQIAKKMGARIVRKPNNLMLNVNKNIGFSEAKSDWILNLDADEEVTPELKTEMLALIASMPQENGYWIPRKNIIFKKWIRHGLWSPDKQLRLFKRGMGKFPSIHVHEYLEVEGVTAELKESMIHYNYESISQFLHKLDTIYTENEVENRIKKGYTVSWSDTIRFPVSDFTKVYFAQEGYKDGMHGLILAILQAFYSFIVFAKLWEKAGFPEKQISLSSVTRQLDCSKKEIQYWALTAQLSQVHNLISRFVLRLKRKYVSSH